MPLVSRTFDQLIDFTRTTAGTYVDETGKIVSTPASRNLLTFTQEFDNAAWVKGASTITPNNTTAPDGTMTADTLVDDATTDRHRVSSTTTYSSVSGATLSVYIKKGTVQYVSLFLVNSPTTSEAGAVFDLDAGTAVAGSAGVNWTATSPVITPVGNGWFRCSVVVSHPTLAGQFRIEHRNSAYTSGTISQTYAGDVNNQTYIWGAQLEANTTATDYTRNNGGVYPPRLDYDPVTLAPKGLLIEEQRTNLLLRSEEFNNATWTKSGATITENAINSPNGTVNADTLVEDTSNGSHQGAQGANFTSGVAYTFSVYAKYLSANRFLQLIFSGPAFSSTARAVFDLSTGASAVNAGTASATSIGNGWWRCSFTVSATSTTSGNINIALANTNAATFIATQYTGDGTSGIYIWGAQLEAGAFATSYIPTVASQVTRTADVATITGANFSQWYNQSEGTFVVEYGQAAGASGRLMSVTTSTTRAYDISRLTDTSIVSYVNWSSGGLQRTIANTSSSVGKIAIAQSSGNSAGASAGVIGFSDTTGTGMPTADTFSIGRYATSYMNGYIRSIRYYPTRLTDAQLQALTA